MEVGISQAVTFIGIRLLTQGARIDWTHWTFGISLNSFMRFMPQNSWKVWLSLLASSACVFSFLMILSPTLSTLLAGSSLQVILAPSWLAFALSFLLWSLLTDRMRGHVASDFGISILSLLTPALVTTSAFGLYLIQESLNSILLNQAHEQNVRLLEQILFPAFDRIALPIMLISALPFFSYGVYLAALFSSSSPSRILTVEFCGILLGVCAGAVVLEWSGNWPMTVQLTVAAGLVATLLLSYLLHGMKRATVLAGAVSVSLFSIYLIPRFETGLPNNIVVRDFKQQLAVKELAHSWTTYGKVQLLRVRSGGLDWTMIALGGGTGIADVVTDSTDANDAKVATAVVALAFRPQSALVLFAGAGRDLLAMKKLSLERLSLTGVELNPEVVRYGLQGSDSQLAKLVSQTDAQLKVGDARDFLETSRQNFDVILFSYAGATVAHYSGAVVHTTQFSLTREALKAAWLRLSAKGTMVVFPGSKMNVIASLKELESQGITGDLSVRTALLSSPTNGNWIRGWDDNVLVVKREPFSANDVADLKTAASSVGLDVVLAPGNSTQSDFIWHQKLLQSAQPSDVLDQVEAAVGARFADYPDDRPFVYRAHGANGFLNWSFWRDRILRVSIAGLVRDRFLFALAELLLLVLVLVAFAIQSRKTPSPWTIRRLLLAVSILGYGGATLHLAIAYRCLLFLGNPTVGLLITTVSYAGGSAIAALICIRHKLSTRQLALGAGGGFLVFGVFVAATYLEISKSIIFSFPLGLRSLVLFLMILPASTGLGLLFPAALSRLPDKPSAWPHRLVAVDALGSAVAIVLAPALIEDYGISTVALVAIGMMLASVALFAQFSRHSGASRLVGESLDLPF